ncbi:MAG: hypothetical protein V3V12_05495 [Gammaproteobacteria bacterium]
MKYIIRSLLLIVFIPSLSYGEDKHAQNKNTHAVGVEALSDPLRNLLSLEMKALQDGMMSIIPSYISGNWEDIAVTAEKMKNGFLLKQRLTESQRKELHTALPAAFIEKDQRFHYLAGMLSHAAKKEKPELINFYFSEMNESCVNCHSQFATHKFPALAPDSTAKKHSH